MRRVAILLTVLFLASLPFTVEATGVTVESKRDGVVIAVEGSAGSTWSTAVEVQADDRVFVEMSCNSCEGSLLHNGTETGSSFTTSTIIHTANSSGQFGLDLTFQDDETAGIQVFASSVPPSPQRPAPGTSAPMKTLPLLAENEAWWGGEVDRPRADLHALERAVLSPTTEHNEHALVQASTDGWLDIVQRAGDGKAELRLFVQAGTSEKELTPSWKAAEGLAWTRIHVNASDRVMVLASTNFPSGAVVVDFLLHEDEGELHAVSSDEGATLVIGHGGQRMVQEVNDTERIHLGLLASTELEVEHLVSGSWLRAGASVVNNSGTVWPLPGASAIRWTCSTPSCAMLVTTEHLDDLGSGKDAPNALDPASEALLNATVTGALALNDTSTGHLVRGVHDVADVLPIIIDAWEESVHMVSITVYAPTGAVEVDFAPLDPMSGLIDEEARRTLLVEGEGSLSTQVGRGTHLLRVSLADQNITLNEPWGNDLDALAYSVEVNHMVVDEGDEPWFPPNETAQVWGERVRWILGSMFLIPVVGFMVMQRRRHTLAQTILAQRARLARIVARLDQGGDVKLERKDLRRALDAVSTLEFEEACLGWGDPDLRHRTDEVSMAAWLLDPRLASQGGNVLLIGVANHAIAWEVVGLRLDSPVGEACSILAVEPRFHHLGEDVFLDTLGAGSVTFLTVEIAQGPTQVDIEFNGLVNGEPRAARAPKALMLANDEEA